ncbi:hypothetical protein AB0G04_09990 [Actinoplanes sp. NPDC023801]|uniref:hypothetical protein n=1 Tax=Actinoplanes sp. NPDC023801 TaxID=3154595 RepID=UPI00340F9985
MGASGWNRGVPYQADITAALRQAREEAHRSGTRQPTAAAAVEEALDRRLDGFERSHGAYVVAYDGDRPAWIYTFGWSGH